MTTTSSNSYPKIYISTNGCVGAQLNSKCLENFVKINKLTPTKNVNEADIVIFYACGLTEDHENKSLQIIKNLKTAMKTSAKLVVWGCLSKQNPESLLTLYDGPCIGPLDKTVFEEMFGKTEISFDDINFSASGKELECFRETLMQDNEEKVSLISNTFSLLNKLFDKIQKKNTPYYILVATGCTGNCTYCGEKSVFGGIKSRPIEDIIAEFDKGLQLGYNRFSLLATDLGAYGIDINSSLSELLRKIINAQKTENYKLILNQIEPHNLINIYSDLEEILTSGKVEELNSPVQSGSNRILKLMGRKYTIEEWKNYMFKIKEKFPDIRLTTQFIVGFPSETEEDFNETKKLLDSVPFLYNIEVFKYSSRPTAPSRHMSEQIPEETKKLRKKEFSYARARNMLRNF